MNVRLPLAAVAAGLIAGMARRPAQDFKSISLIMQAGTFVPGFLSSQIADEESA